MKSYLTQIEEVCLVYKTSIKPSERPQVSSSRDAYNLFLQSWDPDTIEHIEELKVMLLYRAHRLLGIASISKGGLTGTVIDVRIIMQYALKANSSAIILAHNHPSGNVCASHQDVTITEKIQKAAEYLDIELIDHIILGPSGEYGSMREECMM